MSSATTSRRRSRRGKSHRPKVDISQLGDLHQIIDRARAGPLPDEECQKIRDVLGTLSWLQSELQNKNLTIARLRRLFGLTSSEKTRDVCGDPSGKNQAASGEKGASNGGDRDPGNGGERDPDKKGKRKGHGRNGASDYTGANRVAVEHDSLKPKDPCPTCPKSHQGKLYELKTPRTLVRIVGKAPLEATIYEQQTLRCNLCGTVFVADPPPDVGEEKYSASAKAIIGFLRYGAGFPFHRLERLEAAFGIPMPASTQWEISADVANSLEPLWNEMVRQAAQARLFHNDDMTMRVQELQKEIELEKRAGTSSRTGIFSTNILAELEDGQRIALFFTGRKHAGENLTDLLRHRSPSLPPPLQMCDGLDRNLPKEFETILINCLLHGRRNFVSIFESFPTPCRVVIETLRDVYRNDAITKERMLSDEERLRYHREHSRPLMVQLRRWMRNQIATKQIEPNSPLGKAIAYMEKRWRALTRFYTTPGAPLDNNLCERALKRAVLHRKNAMFYKTRNGARVGDLFMSLIHTAELAAISPYDYLVSLIRHAQDVARRPAEWMPWNYRQTLATIDAPPPAAT
jgi:hypothetical protein